jgi:hypothetical protein
MSESTDSSAGRLGIVGIVGIVATGRMSQTYVLRTHSIAQT